MTSSIRRLTDAEAPWLTAPPTRRLMATLQDPEQDAARFVGGCVRNALLGLDVDDVDIATIHPPETVITRLETAGLKAVPTGLAHGTVTAVVDGQGFEITTLRRDVATDGRRATIAYTSEWEEDAQRRDFTMNALFAAQDGAIFDCVGGVADLSKGRVRFIGDATTRIREDFLRILRFFRMHAWYGKGVLDAAGLTAARTERQGLEKLSGERIQREMLKLLAAGKPVPVLEVMADSNIMDALIPEGIDLARLGRVIDTETRLGLAPEPVRRLAALVAQDPRPLARRWRLSNAATRQLVDGFQVVTSSAMEISEGALRRLIHAHGRDVAREHCVLSQALGDHPVSDARAKDMLSFIERWERPDFPLKGADAIAAGVPRGPEMGRVLEQLEAAWVESDFTLDRAALLSRLAEWVRK